MSSTYSPRELSDQRSNRCTRCEEEDLASLRLAVFRESSIGPLRRFLIKGRDRLLFVDSAAVECFEAEGNYVRITVGEQRHLVRQALNRVEERLDPGMFCRIHRSVIVNIDHVEELHPLSHGKHTVVMRSGKTLVLTTHYRKRLERLWCL